MARSIRITLAGVAILTTVGLAQAGQCRLACANHASTCTLDGRPVDPAYLSGWSDCGGLSGKAADPGVYVWYLNNGDLVKAVVKGDRAIEAIVARAEDSRSLLRPTNKRSAGSPFDTQGDDGSDSTGAKIGLPFGQILPPEHAAMLTDVAPADTDGNLLIFEMGSGRQVAHASVRAGRVPLGDIPLAEETVYRYEYVGGQHRFNGMFKVTSKQTASDVGEDTAYALRKESLPAEAEHAVRVQQLIDYGLRWDALQTLINGGHS